MKFCITYAINDSFDKGLLPLSLRQCVITCLPKKGKPRNNIKNWRPLSMLSVIYKLASAAIANRIKPHLSQIIDNTQCGFVPGRYIGECTRLIFDIMKFTEDKQLPGMLVLIDFEKAFDSISWSFIYQTMAYLGFSKDLIKWIKLFNHNIKATIIQCGVLSEFIDIQRGCRQGDPIAPYLFIIVAQILTIMIKNNKKIKGISIENVEIKLTQFADDITLILDGSIESLHAAFNTLEIFGSISGLKVNTEKTQIAWIGKKKHSKHKININNCSLEAISSFKLLGILFSVNLDDCLKMNFVQKMIEIKELICKWNKRYLTPLGKITIVKTFLLAKLNHLFTSLPNPDDSFVKEINELLFKFIWSSKPDKINRYTVMLDKKIGGLKMINIKDFVTSLKILWIRRLFMATGKSLWITLFEINFNVDITKAINFGPGYFQLLKNRTTDKFWINVFEAWQKFSDKIAVKTNSDLFSSPLWYNSKMSCHDMYIPIWFQKGIKTISDIINPNGLIMTMDEVKHQYSFSTINPLHYLRVKHNVKQYIKKYKFDEKYIVQRPFVPSHIVPIWKNKKGVSAFYKTLTKHNENEHTIKLKWENEMQVTINKREWSSIFNVTYQSANNNLLVWFQLKLLYRILGTREYLNKINIVNSSDCTHCHEKETIVHMFVECDRVKVFWREIEKLIYETNGLKIHFSKFDILFGYQNLDRNRVPLNVFLLISKKYIYDINRNNGILNLVALKHKFQQTYFDEYYLPMLKDKQDFFTKLWEKWCPMLCVQ